MSVTIHPLRLRDRLEHLLPFLSAALFFVAFPPVNLWPLMWLAPIPLVIYILNKPLTWKRALVLYLAAYAHWVPSVYWFCYVAPLGMWLAPLYRAILWPIFAWVVQKVRAPAYITVPAAWALQEFAAVHFPLLAFPFRLVAYSQLELLSFVQIADIGGPYLVGALVMMWGSLVAMKLSGVETKWRAGAVACALLLILSVIYGAVRIASLEIRQGPSALIVQPNIPQSVKELVQHQNQSWKEREKRVEEIYQKHKRLTRDGLKEKVDFILWSEASVPDWLEAYNKTYYPTPTMERLSTAAHEFGAHLITGVNVAQVDVKPAGLHNSAVILDGNGNVVGRYDKVWLVAFGEYVPDFFRWFVEKASNLKFSNYTPGSQYVVWEAAGTRLSPVICFEGLVPDIPRECAGKGAQVIVNMSNDGWFKDSGELDETLAIARFRSFENRVGFVRATNTGISAVIDPAGRIVRKIEGKEVEGSMIARLPLTDSGSVYRSLGDAFIWVCGLLLAGLGVISLTRK